MKNKIKTAMLRAQMKMMDFFTKEDGISSFVAAIILLGIAVLLGVLFKEQISELVTGLFDDINEQTSGLMETIK